MAEAPWIRFARAAPLAVIDVLASDRGRDRDAFHKALEGLPSSSAAIATAVDSAGVTARRVLYIAAWFDGHLTPDVLAYQLGGADPDELDEAVDRLIALGLAEEGDDGGLTVGPSAAWSGRPGVSLADSTSMSSEILARICRRLGTAVPAKKTDRVAAIAACFADPTSKEGILACLTPAATALFHRMVNEGAVHQHASSLGIETWLLDDVMPSAYSYSGRNVTGVAAALAELVDHGIAGVNACDGWVWVWREAWVLADRPLFSVWPIAPHLDLTPADPTAAASTAAALRMVSLQAAALTRWQATPPPALKDGSNRLGKQVVRAAAKALVTDEATLTMVVDASIGAGLLALEIVNTSGRGRNVSVDRVWRSVGPVFAAWQALPPLAHWASLVAAWTNRRPDDGHVQLQANRRLVLWELAGLPADVAIADAAAFAAWMEHRYSPVGVDRAVDEVVVDLRALGIVTATGPLALTDIGRQVLTDPSAVAADAAGFGVGVIVQGDHTVVCPPGVDPATRVRLAGLGVVASDGAAAVYRLDRGRITAAAQAGATADELLAWLTDISTVPVPSGVRHLVLDAVAEADRVQIVSATTVIITRHPADLVLATKVVAAKLTPVTDTVATSPLVADKVRAALARKGLAPKIVAATPPDPDAQVAARDAEVAQLRARAEEHRRQAVKWHNPGLANAADRADEKADRLADPASTFRLTSPLAATPSLLE